MGSREHSTTVYLTDAAHKRLKTAVSRLERERPDMEIGFGDGRGTSRVPAWVNVVTIFRGGAASLEQHVRDVNAVLQEVGSRAVIEVAPRRRGLRL